MAAGARQLHPIGRPAAASWPALST